MKAWRSGQDVEGDFHRLEQIIRYSEKDTNLIYRERQKVLHQFPAQRQLWRPLLLRKLFVPLMASMVLSVPQQVPFQRQLHRLLRLQFFACVVWTPIAILLLFKRRQFSSSEKNDVGDIRPCLLEQWITAVMGTFLLGPMISPNSRILFRLAAMCSIFQFPRLHYELNEMQRPVDGLSYVLQKVVAILLSPWWVVAEIGLSGFPPAASVGAGSTMLLAYGFPSLVKHRSVIVRSFGLGVLGRYCLWNKQETILYTVEWLATFWSLENRMTSLLSCFRSAWPWIVSVVAFLGPSIHILAFTKLIQVKLMNNVSLDMDSTQMEAALQKPPSWYGSLKWREPKRIWNVIRTAKDQWIYNFLFAGSVDEKLRQERQMLLRKQELEGTKVWERIEFSNATQWKDNAMKRMADQHQHDYERGTFEDPLGVAVYRTLGIGLGFQFDHMSNSSAIPETRRLQARAAKSAVRRVQDLYGMNAEVLKNIPDGKEILQKTLELKIQIEQETDSLAKRLSELIPMDLALDNANATLVRQIDSRKYERVSANEYVVNEQGAASTSPVVKELLQSMPGNHSEDNDMEEWERQMTTLFEDNDDDDAMKTYMA